MNDYNSTVTPLITPEELAALFKECTVGDAKMALKMATHCFDVGKAQSESDELQNGFFVMGAIWNAGRIQGIREERAKRKQKLA